MKLFKLIVLLLILGFIGVFIWENLSTFQALVDFQLNLYVQESAQWHWQHHIYTLLGIAAGLGLILGVLIMIKPYLKARRSLLQEREARREMQATVEVPPDSHSEPIPPEVMTSAPAGNESAAGVTPDEDRVK